MKHIAGWGVAVASALMFGVTVGAQQVPEQFVVSGKAAEQLQDFTSINLATAQRIAEICIREAIAQKVQITIMILDNDGNHVYSDRMDGQGYLNIVTAEMKARTALETREPSKVRMNRSLQDPTGVQEVLGIQNGFFANSGGLPIVVNKQMIGAVGVGGSAPRVPVWSDEICAHKAMVEVIGPSVAPLVQDLPGRQNTPPANPVPVPRFANRTTPKSSLPPEWVVGGAGAASVVDGNQISLAAAKQVARACRDWAASRNGTASIYILSSAGEIVHMERMDGQAYNNIRTALFKAETALKMREPTSVRAAQLRNNQSQLARFAFYYDLYGVSGGLPIVVDGQMIGSIGVGGGAGGGDENCAMEGLKAVFGTRVLLPEYPAATAQAK